MDGNEISILTRITIIFILLNGATGGQVENIPLPLAGHFVIWCNNNYALKGVCLNHFLIFDSTVYELFLML